MSSQVSATAHSLWHQERKCGQIEALIYCGNNNHSRNHVVLPQNSNTEGPSDLATLLPGGDPKQLKAKALTGICTQQHCSQ